MNKKLKKCVCWCLALSMAVLPVQASGAAEEKQIYQSSDISESSANDIEPIVESETVFPESETQESESVSTEGDTQESETVFNGDAGSESTFPESEKADKTQEDDVSVPKAQQNEWYTAPEDVEEINKITVENKDDENGILVLKIENPQLSTQQDQVIVPVWTQANGQDDIVWYEAQKKEDGWYVTVKAQEHHYEAGTYNIHFYSKDIDGVMTLLDGIKETINVSLVPKLDISVNGYLASITLKNAFHLSASDRIYFPVWGESGGQNDIVWYVAQYVSPGEWTALVDLTGHGETGKYNVHAYVEHGSMDLLMASSFNIEAAILGKVSVAVQDNEAGTFQLKIDDVSAPGGVRQILVPVWSNKGGQDDIVWYNATKRGNSWYVDVDALNHHNDTGIYHAHVYVYGNFGASGLACYTTVDVKMNTEVSLQTEVSSDQTQITVTLKNYNVRASGNAVKFAVWGDKNGQNDIVWYDAKKYGKNTWTYTIDLKKHKEAGRYNIHVYESGKTVTLIDHTSCVIEGISSGKMKVSKIDEKAGKITLTLSDIFAPSGISKIEVAVWTQKNGQDDIVWYAASKKGDGYEVAVPMKNHNNEYGVYIAHAYAYDRLGTEKLAANINFEMSKPKPGEETYSCSGMTIENVNFTTGTFCVRVSGVKASSGVAGVKIPVWAELNGQDDIIWYNATKSGDCWYVDVNTIKNHHVVKGTYLAHAYVVTNSGKEFLLGGASTIIQWDLSLGKPGIDVSLWQGVVKWDEVKASGIDFAMIRTGYGKDSGQQDPKFEYNIKEAKKNGIKVGVYHYSYAQSVEDAIAEARYCLSILKKAGVPLDYPVAFDIEETSRYDVSKKDENSQMIQAFCDTIEAAGYDPIVYANSYFLTHYVNYGDIKKYGIWMAKWVSDITAGYGDFENVQIWQYSDNGNMSGISGAVDMNVSFLK